MGDGGRLGSGRAEAEVGHKYPTEEIRSKLPDTLCSHEQP